MEFGFFLVGLSIGYMVFAGFSVAALFYATKVVVLATQAVMRWWKR